MAKDKVVKRGVYLYLDGSPIKNDIKSIEIEMRGLVAMQKKMVIGSEEYTRTGDKIRALRGIISEHNTLLRSTGDNIRSNTTDAENSQVKMGGMASGIKKYLWSVMSFIGGITGVFFTLKKAISDYLNLDSAYSDVMKYTGMSRDQVVDLNENLKKMDTKTSRVELNKLLADAGKIGVEGKKKLLEFAEAGDIVRMSLGDDLGEDAIKNIGKLAKLFGDADRLGIKSSMLSIGSVVNELASTTTSDEKFIVDFTARMAGIGKQAKLDIPILASYASVLDQDMQQVEVSSTALQGVMMKMFTAPKKMAKLAGLEVSSFAELLKTDANEALLQFLSALQKRGDMNALAPIFDEMKLDGAGASKVLSSLASNVDRIRATQIQAAQAYRDGTSVVNEFNVKNNDLTAISQKQKKVFQERIYQLGEELLPIVVSLMSGANGFVSVLGKLLSLLIKHGAIILGVGSALLAYQAGLKITVLWQNRLNIAQSAGAVATGALKGSLYLLQIAYYLLTGQMAKARGAMVAFTLATKLNSYAALFSLITAATAALIIFTRKTDAAVKAQEDLADIRKTVNDSLADHKSQIDLLLDSIHNENIANGKRLSAIGKLKSLVPGYTAEISKEGKVIKENTTAIEEYMSALEAQLKMEASRNKLKELYSKQFKVEEQVSSKRDNLKKLSEEPIPSGPDVGGHQAMGRAANYYALKSSLDQSEKELSDLNVRIKNLKDYYRASMNEASMVDKDDDDDDDDGNDDKGGGDPVMDALDDIYNKKRAEIKRNYLSGNIKTQDDFNKQMEQLELDQLEDKLKIAGLEPKEREAVLQQVLDVKIKMMEKMKELDQKKIEDDKKLKEQEKKDSEEALKERLSAIDRNEELELMSLAQKRLAGQISDDEYYSRLNEAHRRYIDERLLLTDLSEDERLRLLKEKQQIEIDDFEKNQSDYRDKMSQQFDFMKDFADDFGELFADLITDSEVSLGDFFKKTIMMAISALENIVTIAITERTVKNIGTLGFIGLAKAAGEIALIKAAFGIAKGAIGNFYDGGYTTDGDWNEPKGIVHSNEFVSNRFAVRNPSLRPVFDLIDYAQRTGSVSNLTSTDVASVLPGSSSRTGTTPIVLPSDPDTEQLKLLSELRVVLALLNRRLHDPIVAETYVSGRGGINEAQELVDRMNTNASRQNML